MNINKARHTWTLLHLLLDAQPRHKHISTRTHFHTPAPPQLHPAEPSRPAGLGSSSKSGPCWLKVPPSVCVCGVRERVRVRQPLPGRSARSMFLTHGEWKREKRGRTGRRWVWSGKQRRMGSDVGASRGRAVNPRAIRRRELTRT